MKSFYIQIKDLAEKNHFLSFTLSTLSETSVELRDWVTIPLPVSCSLSAVLAFHMKTVILIFYQLAFPSPTNHAEVLKLYGAVCTIAIHTNSKQFAPRMLPDASGAETPLAQHKRKVPSCTALPCPEESQLC